MSVVVQNVKGKGRGVFAARDFQQGEIIERSPVITFAKETWTQLEDTVFYPYCYFWGENLEDGALALGVGSLFNHSYHPNARFFRQQKEQIIEFVTVQKIAAGEEITINYNGIVDDMEPLWFDVLEQDTK
ncbi:MAG: SET domain-containing protein [Negativicutes bacterium]|nr:SET domain-containing protein [Negativicutes bacterium]